MDKDSYLIFEAYVKEGGMPYPEFAKLSKHANSKLPEDKPKEKLKYDYEIVAYLPRDIDISTREGQDKVLSLAYKELVKRVTNKYKNPERAASNMFYDEDFPMELVSQYSRYQKHGFPDVEENDYREQMPDSKEEYMDKEESAETSSDIKRKKDNESRWMSMLKSHFGKEYKREGADPYVDFLERYSPFWDDSVLRHFADMYNKTWASEDPESKIDVEHFLKIKNEMQDKAEAENEKRRIGAESEERRLDPKCWKGYHKQGTKLKDGKRVNNCIKNS